MDPPAAGRANVSGEGRANAPAAGWASVPTSGVPQLNGSPTGRGFGTSNGVTLDADAPPPGSGETDGPDVAGSGTTTGARAGEDSAGRVGEDDGQPAATGTGRRAAAEPQPADAPMRPGDVGLGHIAFWDEEAVAHFRSEWHEVKAEFVDDPVTALTRAHDLLTDAVNELTEALLAERDELDPLRTTGTPDTESMRMAMRGYREFLDRILAL